MSYARPPAHSDPAIPRQCAVVIVTFRPGRELGACLAGIHGQSAAVGPVIVVDNTPGPPNPAVREVLALDSAPGVQVLRPGENLGQAAGLNLGFARAAALGCSHVLTLDQDSRPRPGWAARMCEAWNELAATPRPAVLGCNYEAVTSQGVHKIGVPHATQGNPYATPTVITAGSLTSLAAFKDVGPFREEFFIDHVDHDWCLRARGMGLAVYQSPEILLDHLIGAVSHHTILGKRLETSNHPAFRRYFWHRNLVALLVSHGRTDPAWCARLFFYHLPAGLVTMLLFEPDTWQKLTMTLRGLWDGLLGRFDRAPLPSNPSNPSNPEDTAS